MLPPETLLVAGPTGAGKTALSLLLAERLGGEIVGADAFQVYDGLPILTAQPSPAQRGRIPHHLVGHVPPSESYDAARYRREALAALKEIASRGRRPILVGGTGLYLKVLLVGLDDLPERDPILREEFASEDLPSLFARVKSLDPVGAEGIDSRNRHRVERALEILLLTGRPLPRERLGRAVTPPGIRGFLLVRAREELDHRIAANVKGMFSKGVEKEVASLPPSAMGPTACKTLGLAEIRGLLEGRLTQSECEEAITLATRRYAKRQMTWFRGQHDFEQIDLSGSDDPELGAAEILRSLRSRGCAGPAGLI